MFIKINKCLQWGHIPLKTSKQKKKKTPHKPWEMVLYFQSDACDVCVYVSKYEHVSNSSQLACWGDVGHHHSLSKEGIHIRSGQQQCDFLGWYKVSHSANSGSNRWNNCRQYWASGSRLTFLNFKLCDWVNYQWERRMTCDGVPNTLEGYQGNRDLECTVATNCQWQSDAWRANCSQCGHPLSLKWPH